MLLILFLMLEVIYDSVFIYSLVGIPWVIRIVNKQNKFIKQYSMDLKNVKLQNI